MDTCEKHPHERGAGICGRCGGSWCSDCLVFTHGSRKPPMCMACAMYAGGVRSTATRPAMPRRELKARLKAAKAAAKSGDDADQAAEEPGEAETAAAVEVRVPDPVVSDWETPWWEDRQPTLAD